MNLAEIEIRGGPIVLASDAEVDDLETRTGAGFPDGYREFVTQLGEGVLNDFVRVLPPWRILAELDEHRGMMSAYWFWDGGAVPFGQQDAIESIQMADTVEGDVLVFHPADRRQIVILPRSSNSLSIGGPDLLEAIDWVLSGDIGGFGRDRYFERFDSRLEHVNRTDDGVAEQAGVSFAREPPILERSPRDVLMAYFAELRAVEEWAIAKAGGPEAFYGDAPPDTGGVELVARSAEVHTRYCSKRLANALRSASVTVTSPPEHHPAAIRVVEETVDVDRAVFRTAEGTFMMSMRRYVLGSINGEWRITSQADLGSEIP